MDSLNEITTRPCGCAGHGRHKNSCPEKNGDAIEPGTIAPEAVTAETWYGLPIMPDEEMELYGGDLAAHESYSPRSGRPMATIRTAQPAAHPQPDLNHKGLLVNRHDPSQLFHFAYLLEDGSSNYQQGVQTLRQRGYRPVTPADFHLHSSLRGVFTSQDDTATGRLMLGGAFKGAATVLYCQDKRNYDYWRAWDRRFTEHIQKTVEQQAAEIQGGLNSGGGAGVSSSASIDYK